MDLGYRVRDLRNARHLSQVELAARAGVARNTLNRIENGHLMPTAPVIEHLAEALDVTPGALFEEPVPLAKAPSQGPREKAGPPLPLDIEERRKYAERLMAAGISEHTAFGVSGVLSRGEDWWQALSRHIRDGTEIDSLLTNDPETTRVLVKELAEENARLLATVEELRSSSLQQGGDQEYGEILLSRRRADPETFWAVIEVIKDYMDRGEDLSVTIEDGYVEAGLKIRELD
jgi:transcriptional regulator with XRE-family HTH domain